MFVDTICATIRKIVVLLLILVIKYAHKEENEVSSNYNAFLEQYHTPSKRTSREMDGMHKSSLNVSFLIEFHSFLRNETGSIRTKNLLRECMLEMKKRFSAEFTIFISLIYRRRL